MACIQLDFADPVAGEASCYSLSKYDLLHPDTLAAMQIHSTRRRLEKKTRDKNYQKHEGFRELVRKLFLFQSWQANMILAG